MDQQGWIPYSEQAEEKEEICRKLKKTGSRCFLLLFCLALSAQLFSVIIIYILNFIQGSYAQGLPMSQEMLNFVASMLPCLLADAGVILLACGILKTSMRHYAPAAPQTQWKLTCCGAMAVLGAGTIGGIIYSVYGGILELLGVSLPQPSFDLTSGDIPALILSTAYICILAPVMEELIFRGFILRSLQKYGNISAVLVSAVLFSFFHQNLVQLVPAFITGLVLGFIAVKSKSLIPPILAHIFNNVVSMLPQFLPDGAISNNIVLYIYSLLVLGLSIAGIRIIIVRYRKEYAVMSHVENDSGFPVRKKFGAVFSTPWAVAYLCLYVLLIALGFLIQWVNS